MASKPPSTIWPVPGACAITLNCLRSGSAMAGAPPCNMRGRFGPIATPPCFKKYRRENLRSLTPSQHLYFMVTSPALASLKFRGAQHQPGDDAQIHLLARIIKLGLQDLRVIELLFECFNRSRARLPAEEYSHRAVERRLGVR